MEKGFEPLFEGEITEQFYNWDADIPEASPLEIDKEAAFAAECDAIREANKVQGYEEGLAQAKEEIEALKSELNASIAIISEPLKLIDKIVTESLVQALYWLANECIKIELSQSREKLIKVTEAITQVLPIIKEKKQIALNPQDLIAMTNQLKESFPNIEEILIADDELSTGDFYIESDAMVVDGRLSSRIRTLIAEHFDIGEPQKLLDGDTHE